MTNRVPDWLTPVAWVWIALALLTTAWLAYDAFARRSAAGGPRGTVAERLAWVLSGLYLGPFALLLRRGAGTAALPGGAASAVAHLVGVPLVVASGLTIAGTDLWVMILVIGVIAMALLYVHETVGARTPAGTAALVAVVTVLAFDVGMGGWMLVLHVNELMPPPTDAAFWLLMQLGVVLGLVTGAPAVAWLRARAPGAAA